jgi:para-nitrobenzyl esterase
MLTSSVSTTTDAVVTTTDAVVTTTGPVVGDESNGVRAYKGLPFATAPRFRIAAPPRPWSAPLRCTAHGPLAPQRGHLDASSEAACLSLNVWTPATSIEKPLPVLFFVHGGAFVTGGGADYDGAFLAARGPAVIVTINYRLGPLGFLQLYRRGGALGEANNLAMTDTLAALEWVRANIAQFGGDPDAITLFGQSAGASMVIALMTLPQAQGKFRAAVAYSVPGRGIMAADHAEEVTRRILAELRLDGDADALAALPLPALFAATETVGRQIADELPAGTLFGPVLDGTVIPLDPANAVAAGVVRDVPLWLGSCRDEMEMFLRSDPPAAMIGVTERAIRSAFGDAGWERLLACYRATASANEDPRQALLSDALWHRPLADLARGQAAAGGQVWLSRFDHRPALEPFLSQGPTHGADNACLWAHPPTFMDRPVLGRKGGPMTLTDVEVAARLQSCLLRFVASGAPDTTEIWPAFATTNQCLAIFDRPFRITCDSEGKRFRAWVELAP